MPSYSLTDQRTYWWKSSCPTFLEVLINDKYSLRFAIAQEEEYPAMMCMDQFSAVAGKDEAENMFFLAYCAELWLACPHGVNPETKKRMFTSKYPLPRVQAPSLSPVKS